MPNSAEKPRSRKHRSGNLDQTAHQDRIESMAYLASGLCHELIQPLFAAQNFLSVALSICQRQASPDAQLEEAVTGAMSQVERASRIVKHLHAFMRHHSLSLEELDLNQTVQDMVALMHHEFLAHKISLRLNLQIALPRIQADNTLVQQVILNLLRNAMDAISHHQGQACDIEVETVFESADRVRLSVSDTGPGISPQMAERLFQPFHSTKSSGMGVGLSISEKIIEAHHGALWATNRPGGGATFSFTLPVSQGAKT